MDWLNYHHLHHFWVVAKEGGIARACEKLHVTQPTVSGQLRQLEGSLRALANRVVPKVDQPTFELREPVNAFDALNAAPRVDELRVLRGSPGIVSQDGRDLGGTDRTVVRSGSDARERSHPSTQRALLESA